MKIIIITLLSSLLANAGTEMGNGGDAVLQAFQLRGLQMGWFLKEEKSIAAKYGIDADKFLQTVKDTILEGKEQLFLNGVEVDAINYPSSKKIEVSRSRWEKRASQNAYFEARRIVLHEYLWVYGINDENYLVSNSIILDLERIVGSISRPEIQDAVLDAICYAIRSKNYERATKMLTWGLDLNRSCSVEADFGAKNPTPMHLALTIPQKFEISAEEQASHATLIRQLLIYGADPNGSVIDNSFGRQYYLATATILRDCAGCMKDFRLAKLFLEFGANPNLLQDMAETKTTVFMRVLFYFSRHGGSELVAKFLPAYLQAGADVNAVSTEPFSTSTTAARMIVRSEYAKECVEILLQSGKVDWCTKTQKYYRGRAIDEVREEYKPLLDKYNVSCP